MNSMPTSPSGSSRRKPPDLTSCGVDAPGPLRYQGRVGSHAVSSSSLEGLRVVWWMTAMRASYHGTHTRRVIRSAVGGRRSAAAQVVRGRLVAGQERLEVQLCQ